MLIGMLLIAGLVFAITEIDVPVPIVGGGEPSETTGSITILANGTAITGERITINTKSLVVEVQELAKDKEEIFLGLNNKELSNTTSAIIGTGTKINPADIKYSQISDGVSVKILNKSKSENKVFQINEWDGKSPILITVCQDKDSDGECTGTSEYAKATIHYEAVEAKSLREALAKISKKFVSGLTK